MDRSSPERPSQAPETTLKMKNETMSRRDAIARAATVGAGVLATRFLGKNVPDITPSEPTQSSDSPESSLDRPTTTPEATEALNSPETELVTLYGDGMREEDYKTKDEKLNFMRELGNVAQRLNPDNPNLTRQLAAVINFESGGSFSPSVQNKHSEATGLIQFMKNTAENMGHTLSDLSEMTPHEQLEFVETYLQDRIEERGVTYNEVTDVYMGVLWPAGMGKDFDHILFARSDRGDHERLSYIQNHELDINLDGAVSVGEATEIVVSKALSKNEQVENLLSSDAIEKREPLVRIKEKLNAFNELIKSLPVDRDRLETIIEVNSQIIQNAERDEYENSIPGFGEGRSLVGVTMALDEVYHGEQMIEDLRTIESAYMAADVLRNHPDKFAEMSIDDPLLLKILPVGSLIVFNPNPPESPDFENDKGHGRIVIVQKNEEDGTCRNGSDRMTKLDEDLTDLTAGFSVFIPIQENEK